MTDTATTIATPNGPTGSELRPDDIAQRRFASSFRGYDTDEVRSFLNRVAAQSRILHERISGLSAELEAARTVQPAAVIDLTQTPEAGPDAEAGEADTSREEEDRALAEALVESARQEAALILARANDEAARIVLRARAESRGKPADGGRVVVTGSGPDDVEAARAQARAMIAEARAVRERILTDLAKRRRTAHIQLEQLRAAREKLQETMREARRVIDASSRDLSHVEVEARLAAEAAGRRVAAEPLPTVEELDAELSGGRFMSTSLAAGSGAEADGEDERSQPEVELVEASSAGVDGIEVEQVEVEQVEVGQVEVGQVEVGQVEAGQVEVGQVEAGQVGVELPAPAALVPIEAGDDIEMVTLIGDPARSSDGEDEGVVLVVTDDVTATVGLEEGHPVVTVIETITATLTGVEMVDVVETADLVDVVDLVDPVDVVDVVDLVDPVDVVDVVDVVDLVDVVDPVGEVDPVDVVDDTDPGTPSRPDEVEAVHVIAVGHGMPTEPVLVSEPVSDPEPAAQPAAVTEAPPARRRKVDDLFAKLRAERAAATERAREVLSAAPHSIDGSSALAEEQADPRPVPATDLDRVEVRDEAARIDIAPLQLVVEPAVVEPAVVEPAVVDPAGVGPAPLAPAAHLAEPGPSPLSPDDEAVLERRNHVLELVRVRAAKQVKRHLQDEHGSALAQLRRSRGRVSVDNLLGTEQDQAARCVALVLPSVAEAAAAGQRLVSGAEAELPALVERCAQMAHEFAISLSSSLRTRLADAIDEGEQDLASVMGQAYREWTTDRLSDRVREVLDAGFAVGAFLATDPTLAVRWVLDDGDEPCSDCDDNVLNGVQPWGEPFPTGELYPPVHAGCRCLVVPEGPLPGLIE